MTNTGWSDYDASNVMRNTLNATMWVGSQSYLVDPGDDITLAQLIERIRFTVNVKDQGCAINIYIYPDTLTTVDYSSFWDEWGDDLGGVSYLAHWQPISGYRYSGADARISEPYAYVNTYAYPDLSAYYYVDTSEMWDAIQTRGIVHAYPYA